MLIEEMVNLSRTDTDAKRSIDDIVIEVTQIITSVINRFTVSIASALKCECIVFHINYNCIYFTRPRNTYPLYDRMRADSRYRLQKQWAARYRIKIPNHDGFATDAIIYPYSTALSILDIVH